MENEEVVDKTSEQPEEKQEQNQPDELERLKKENETLKAQKAIWRKKAEKVTNAVKEDDDGETQPEEPKKTNQQTGLSREEAILISKGYEIEEIDKADKLAKINGVSLLEAIEDDYIKGLVQARKDKERSAKAELPASQGIISTPKKDPGDMTRDEHREWVEKELAKVS